MSMVDSEAKAYGLAKSRSSDMLIYNAALVASAKDAEGLLELLKSKIPAERAAFQKRTPSQFHGLFDTALRELVNRRFEKKAAR
jgi:hypothetical protein